jgi:hypothetical protein
MLGIIATMKLSMGYGVNLGHSSPFTGFIIALTCAAVSYLLFKESKARLKLFQETTEPNIRAKVIAAHIHLLGLFFGISSITILTGCLIVLPKHLMKSP